MKFYCAGFSKKGGRAVNEDYAEYYLNNQKGCWVMADGLGGHGAGEVASELAVKTIVKRFGEGGEDLSLLLSEAHQAVQDARQWRPEYRQMRTTVSVLICEAGQASWAHVGDSRIYHFREGLLRFQTKDHSVCQALVNAGEISPEQMRGHEDRNRLLRVLGSDGEVKPSFLKAPVPLMHGDVFLLCTDGFWELVTEREMEELLTQSRHPEEWLIEMEKIVEKRAVPGHDNYSAMAVFIVDSLGLEGGGRAV